MAVGRAEFRVDARGKVTGDALYPADLTDEAILHAKVVFSSKPHARMTRMDTRAAEAVPGVVRIFTAADVPVNEYGLMMHDQPVLVGLNDTGRSEVAADVSRWEGDQIAVIVAETIQAANAAAEALVVEWEDLPLVNDVFESLSEQVLVHPEKGTNTVKHYKIRKGDVAAAWAKAEVVIEGRYEVPLQEHAFLQPEAAVAYIDDEGRVTVKVGGQFAHEDQEQIAHALNLPLEQVRVIYPAIGGAFGGREDMSLQIVLALAAWRLHQAGINRPVRCQWSREESIIGHHKRHRAVIEHKLGATRDGKILVVEADGYLDAGAYNYTSNKVLGNMHFCTAGPYEVPNARIDSRALYTTNVPGGAFRGFGAPQGAFAIETQMNKLAEALNMDPVELRRINTIREGSISISMTPFPPGVSMPTVIEEAARAAKWGRVPARPAKPMQTFQSLPASADSLRYGRGFAIGFKNVGYSFGFPEGCNAKIELRGGAEIEEAVLYHASAEVGQGTHTALRQMAAEALKLPPGKVRLVMSDTATSGNSGSVSASRMTFMAGNAIRLAAETALKAWDDEERPAIGDVRYHARKTTMMDPETGYGDVNITYGYVAEAVDVAVDIETGHIQVTRVVCADDVGKAINPMLVEGQIEGAVVQAYGYAVTENLRMQDGRILNPRLSTYLIPGIKDIPTEVESVIVEVPDPQGPWGARGMAEMPYIPLAPAIGAALHDATGVWFDTLPLTPERVLRTLREHGATA